MTTYRAFNNLMQQFLEELGKVFPADSKLRVYAKQYPILCESNPRKPMEVFSRVYGPYAAKIQTLDETLFDDVPVLLESVDVRALWSKADADTRSAIWKYFQQLNFFATTTSLIPPEMMSVIDSVAQSCAEKMQDGQMNPADLLGMLPNLMQNMSSMMMQQQTGEDPAAASRIA